MTELEPETISDAPIVRDDDGFAARVAGTAALTGAVIGNLELTERIGVGGMGVVYKALHRTLQTPYALKILHPQFSSDEAAVERFRLEAVACSKLKHENIVFVTDFGFEADLGLYIAMEFLDGGSLTQLIRQEGPLSPGRMVRIGEQMAGAMAAAHRLDIVHRDLKPDNIVILSDPDRRDFVKILDFGIAKVRSNDGRELTGEGSAVGTPRYMAPEQLMDKGNVNAAADIYAMGCVFYAMLAGEPPFTEGSDFEILTSQVTHKPAPLSNHRPDLEGTPLAKLVHQMLKKQVQNRPASMDEVRERLGAAIQQMRAAGVAGSEYQPRAADQPAPRPTESRPPGHVSVHTVRMTGVIRRIREKDPNSPAAVLLAALPSVGALQGEVLCLALWGILQQDVLDTELGSPDFQRATDQLLLLLQAVLESHPGPRQSSTQAKIFRSLHNLLNLLPRSRRLEIVKSLRPLASHALFPVSLLPRENSGSWENVKAVLNTEITLPRLSDLRLRADTGKHPRVGTAAGDKGLAGMSLLDKLRQDISMRSIKSVLQHDLRMSGSEVIQLREDSVADERPTAATGASPAPSPPSTED
jgi:serine/threonine protein kinase